MLEMVESMNLSLPRPEESDRILDGSSAHSGNRLPGHNARDKISPHTACRVRQGPPDERCNSMSDSERALRCGWIPAMGIPACR